MVRTRHLILVGMLGVISNFPWEIAHSRLYFGVAEFGWLQHLLCCVGASLFDGIATAIIFWIGSLFFCDVEWSRRCSVTRVAFTVILGSAIAITTEKVAIRFNWWRYNDLMPLIPGLQLGITPILQFQIMPALVLFWELPRWTRRADGKIDTTQKQ